MSQGCHAAKDGDCMWKKCPQIRDDEPRATGRHCPLDLGHCEVCGDYPAVATFMGVPHCNRCAP